MHLRPTLLLLSLLCCAHALPVQADVFHLKSGGVVQGEWVNRGDPLAKPYRVKTSEGLTLLIPRGEVKNVVHQRDDEIHYERNAPSVADSVDAQWKLAQWCLAQHLPQQRKVHLRRILQLNPDHLPARRALGYAQVDGRWVTQDEFRREKGFRPHDGRWRLPQDIALIEERNASEQAQRKWLQRLRKLREMLTTPDAAKARQELLAIDDPHAVAPIAELYTQEPLRAVKLIYVSALGQIGEASAVRMLAAASLADPDMEVRVACLDEIEELDPPGVVPFYIKALEGQDNFAINRAAYALARLGDASVAAPLIDALNTTHTFTYKPNTSGGPQTITTTFVNDQRAGAASRPPLVPQTGGGLSVGEGKKTITRHVQNREVLTALLNLTGGPNYGYNEEAWQQWLESQANAGTVLGQQ